MTVSPRGTITWRSRTTATTVAWTTDQVVRRLLPERSVSEWADATGTLTMIERALPEPWAGRKLAELEEGDRFRVVALTRGGRSRLVVPGLVGQEGDILHMMVDRDALAEVEQRLDEAPEAHR